MRNENCMRSLKEHMDILLIGLQLVEIECKLSLKFNLLWIKNIYY